MQTMAEFVACLDGGGTKTEVLWADRFGNCGRHRVNAGCNPQDGGDWLGPIRAALAAIPAVPQHITLAVPGYGEVPRLDAEIAVTLREICPKATILNDVALAYQGAFPDGHGVLVLAGTGSMAMARGPLGQVRVGGWGDGIGDEGSAFWIGRSALSVASQMVDGRIPDTGFAADLAQRLGCTPSDGPFALMGWALSHLHPRAAIAGLAQHVDAMAEAGQSSAQTVLHAAAAELHAQAATSARRAGLPTTAPWSHAGSCFQSRTLKSALTTFIGAAPLPAACSALAGGLILAAQNAGWPDTPAWRATLKDLA